MCWSLSMYMNRRIKLQNENTVGDIGVQVVIESTLSKTMGIQVQLALLTGCTVGKIMMFFPSFVNFSKRKDPRIYECVQQRWKKLTKQNLQNFESEKLAHKMWAKNAKIVQYQQTKPKIAQKRPITFGKTREKKQKLAQP